MRTAKYTVLIRIEGKSGKLIESVSEFPLENEILFNTDRKFLVKEIGFEYNPLEPWKPIKRIILIEK